MSIAEDTMPFRNKAQKSWTKTYLNAPPHEDYIVVEEDNMQFSKVGNQPNVLLRYDT